MDQIYSDFTRTLRTFTGAHIISVPPVCTDERPDLKLKEVPLFLFLSQIYVVFFSPVDLVLKVVWVFLKTKKITF